MHEELEQITPAGVWAGALKSKDVDSRISKAMEVATRLQQKVGETSAQSMAADLMNRVEQVHKDVGLVQAVLEQKDSGIEWTTFLQENCDTLKELFASFDPDEMVTCITDLARKLVEDTQPKYQVLYGTFLELQGPNSFDLHIGTVIVSIAPCIAYC